MYEYCPPISSQTPNQEMLKISADVAGEKQSLLRKHTGQIYGLLDKNLFITGRIM